MSDRDTEVLPGMTEEPPDDEDLPTKLSAAAPRKWFNKFTPALTAVFLLAGGFLGGVFVQKQWGQESSAGATAAGSGSGFSGQMPSGMGASGFPGGGGFGGTTGGGGNATTGTLKSVTASALTMQTSAGKTITVKIESSTTIQQTTTLAKLKAGQSLSVQGSTATDGSITATSVTAS